ncbi:hypothetical protein JTB14_000846 [Gonioctena quinquepunctata]|nr:hypothetical protein JTB14_000846 [Gonioctena quinquepunctata]
MKNLAFVQDPITLKMDNQSAMKMLTKEAAQKRTEHIDNWVHFPGDRLSKEYIKNEEQLTDVFTEAIGKGAFLSMRDNINVEEEVLEWTPCVSCLQNEVHVIIF